MLTNNNNLYPLIVRGMHDNITVTSKLNAHY
jgi:hypothetical protein